MLKAPELADNKLTEEIKVFIFGRVLTLDFVIELVASLTTAKFPFPVKFRLVENLVVKRNRNFELVRRSVRPLQFPLTYSLLELVESYTN